MPFAYVTRKKHSPLDCRADLYIFLWLAGFVLFPPLIPSHAPWPRPRLHSVPFDDGGASG